MVYKFHYISNTMSELEEEIKLLKQLGQRIREIRKSRKLSQEELAEICGFDRTYISLLERGKRNLRLINLLKLSRGLGIPVEELLKDLKVGGEKNGASSDSIG